VLLVSQLYPIFFENTGVIHEMSHYTISVYLIFRLYIFSVVKDKARALDMSLTEFFTKRGEYMNRD